MCKKITKMSSGSATNMLESVKFKNFKSFTMETLIDLKPSKIEYLNETNVSRDGVLKGCAFFGSNASGKTNALNAITILLDLLFKPYVVVPDCFTRFNNERKMWFEYTFKIDDHKLVYSFGFDRTKGITDEKLKQDDEVLLDRQIGSAKSFITENTDYDEVDRNTLFLKNIYFNTRFAGKPILNKWFEYLKKSIFFNPIRDVFKIVSFDPKKGQELFLEQYLELHGEKDINEFLQHFDFPFTISYQSRKDTNNLLTAVQLIPVEYRIQFKRKELAPIPFYMESVGNQILLSFLPSYLTVIKNGGMLAIDEFSSGFHNDLEELLVRYFYAKCKDGQLFFVSHSTNILKTSIIRPDQVYAVDFEDKSSVITKFSSRGMRESQNMEKMYLSGAFGGLPLYETKSK